MGPRKSTKKKPSTKETASSLRLLKKQLKRATVHQGESTEQSTYACVVEGTPEKEIQQQQQQQQQQGKKTTRGKKKQHRLRTSDVIAQNLSYLKRM
jgi:hypothetical protein